MNSFVVICRLALAGVFALSAISKLRDRDGSRDAVQAFGVPKALAAVIAPALPVLEALAAVLLVIGGTAGRYGAILGLAMLAAFTVGIGVNLALGRQPDCHCFGSLSKGSISTRSLVRNVVFLALAGVGASRVGPTTGDWLADRTALELLVGVLALVLLAVLLAGWQLFTRYGVLLHRVETLEILARGEDPRIPAPDFELPDLDGVTRTRDDLLAPGVPVLLLHTSPTCGPCEEMLPVFKGWHDLHAGRLDFVMVASGREAQVRAKYGDSGLTVLLDENRAVSDSFKVNGTPAAVLIAPDGKISGGPAHGSIEVGSLVEFALNGVQQPAHDHHHGHDHGALQVGPPPLREGDPAPEVLLDDGSGTPVDPARSVHSGVLVFWDPTCGYCSQITDDLVALQDTAHGLVLVSKGDPEAVRRSGLTAPLFTDPRFAVGDAFGAPGTPCAIAVHEGRIASDLAQGGPEVLDLVRRYSDPHA